MMSKKSKRSMLGLLAMGLFLTLTFFGTTQAAEEVMIAGGRLGGTGYVFYTACSNVLNKYIKDYFFTVTTTQGSPENCILIERGELKIGLVCLVDAMEVYKTKDLGKLRLTVLHTGTCSRFQILVPKDSKAQSIYDLRGKRVSVGPKGGSFYAAFSSILDGLGLSFNDFKSRFIGAADTTAEYKDGLLDAIFTSGTLPTPAALEPIISPKGGKLLSLGDQDIKKITSKYPEFSEVIIPAGTYEKQNYDVKTVGFWCFLGVRDDFPFDLGYRIAKVLTEHHNEVIQNYSGAKYSAPQTAVTERGTLRLHPAAEKYFKESGLMK